MTKTKSLMPSVVKSRQNRPNSMGKSNLTVSTISELEDRAKTCSSDVIHVPEWTSDKPYPHYIPNPYLPFSAQDPEALMYTLDEEGLAVLAEHKHIDYRKDLLDFVRSLPAAFKQSYQIVDRVGEGTFSTVYKAIDHDYGLYDNDGWASLTNSQIGFYHCAADTTRTVKECYRPKRFVAIKKIYVTSSPARIMNEISMLIDLKGEHHVMPIITAIRHLDQVLIVMPFFEHHDFRVYLHAMKLDDMRNYMQGLLESLAHVHQNGIIHRDIKPSNFLYDFKHKRGLLVDFGLAQRESEFTSDSTAANAAKVPFSSPRKRKRSSRVGTAVGLDCKGNEGDVSNENTSHPSTSTQSRPHFLNKEKLKPTLAGQRKPGYYVGDHRPAFRAARAGTRGFRGPEVLFKVVKQTTALDIWSAGVIFLCLLTRQFPFFNSLDDHDALIEIARLVGRREMEKCAARYERRWRCHAPLLPDKRIPWSKLVCHFNNLLDDESKEEQKAFDLLDRLLTLDHEERISAAEALNHPFLQHEKACI